MSCVIGFCFNFNEHLDIALFHGARELFTQRSLWTGPTYLDLDVFEQIWISPVYLNTSSTT